MNLDRRLLLQARKAWIFLSLAVLAGLLAGLAAVFQARQLSRVIAGVFLNGATLEQVMPMLWWLLVAVAVRVSLGVIAETTSTAGAVQIKENVRGMLARKIMQLGPGYVQGERSGELVNTVTQGVEALDAYFSQFLPQLALAGLLPAAYLMLLFPIDPLSAIVLLLTGPLIPFFMFLIGNMAQALTRRQWLALGRMSAYFLDTLQGLATLKTLGRSQEQAGRIAQVSERYRETTMNVLRVTFLSALVLELLGAIGTAIIAVQVGLRLLYGRIGFEEAFFILLLAPEFYLPLRTLGLRFHASMAGVSAARRIYEVLEAPARQPATDLPREPARQVSAKPPEVIFERVSFTYPGRARAAVCDLSLCISAGEVTALVGESGSGKSTVAQLLMRFLAPDTGVIRVDGVPAGKMAVDDWRARIAWVPQIPALFQGTIADNLRVARPGASAADLRLAAQQAGLLEFIERQPKRFDTPVGEGGAMLSGGEAQRLALARAFLRNAPFLLLDEPTAHLDVELERMLEGSIQKLCAGRTALVIAHRLSTVMNASSVLVLAEGRLVESGPPADLLLRGGAFTRLLSGKSPLESDT